MQQKNKELLQDDAMFGSSDGWTGRLMQVLCTIRHEHHHGQNPKLFSSPEPCSSKAKENQAETSIFINHAGANRILRAHRGTHDSGTGFLKQRISSCL
jgi:hypothetical protein